VAFLGLVSKNWFDLLQSLGIVASLLLAIHTSRRETRARQISNLNAMKQDYIQIWNVLYSRPELENIFRSKQPVDRPISVAERLFVKMLIIHLDSAYRAMKAGLFVHLEGLQTDIRTFFAAPVPKKIWEELRALQDRQFVEFVEEVLNCSAA